MSRRKGRCGRDSRCQIPQRFPADRITEAGRRPLVDDELADQLLGQTIAEGAELLSPDDLLSEVARAGQSDRWPMSGGGPGGAAGSDRIFRAAGYRLAGLTRREPLGNQKAARPPGRELARRTGG